MAGIAPVSSSASFRVGTSGYEYDGWAGRFYPEELPRDRWFERYASEFDTVEINATFYGLPAAGTVDAWRRRAPTGFVYALKFSRYGTHMKHLKDADSTIARFLEVARRLGGHLGPILVQLPPGWHANRERLGEFLAIAPGDLRWTVEFRDPSWLSDEIYEVLREHGAALCIHDMIADHPREVTADWVYRRYHGDRYAGSYSPRKLAAEADRIVSQLDRGRDVYAYFNNDVGGHAVRNAIDLRRFVTRRRADDGETTAKEDSRCG